VAVYRKVAMVQEVVFHYRERFFELLRAHLADAGIELVLIHSNPNPDEDVWDSCVDLPWAHRVEPREFRLGRRRLVWQPCRRLLRGCELVIVEQGSRHLMNYLLMAEQLLGVRRVAAWGHGRNFDGQVASRLGEALKARWSLRASWWFAYNEMSASVVATDLGFPPERITVVRNAIDTTQLRALVAAVSDEELAATRQRLGIRGRHVGLYIGGLSPEKRLDHLFEGSDAVRGEVPDFELVVAGAGPERSSLDAFASTRPWVHAVGAVRGAEKAALLRSADLLLMPAWAGLVVLDSFAAGLPIAISGSLPHPPEASYLEHGNNGIVIDDDGDPRRYGLAIADLLRDEAELTLLRRGCLAAAERYTVESMAERFAEGVQRALA
jgi:glycosyltransferase involved in cell wall biosynthesis